MGRRVPLRRLLEEPWQGFWIPRFLRRFLRGISFSGALRVIYAFFPRNLHPRHPGTGRRQVRGIVRGVSSGSGGRDSVGADSAAAPTEEYSSIFNQGLCIHQTCLPV
jgi:hypothetical protein